MALNLDMGRVYDGVQIAMEIFADSLEIQLLKNAQYSSTK